MVRSETTLSMWPNYMGKYNKNFVKGKVSHFGDATESSVSSPSAMVQAAFLAAT